MQGTKITFTVPSQTITKLRRLASSRNKPLDDVLVEAVETLDALETAENGQTKRREAMLADGSMFPQQLLQQIEAEYVRTVTMRGVVGIKVPVDVFVVRIRIGDIVLPGIRVIADSQNQEPILGRNVLNQPLVSLNGPGLLTTLEEI